MVAIVNAPRQTRETHREERTYGYAGFHHTFEETIRHFPAAYIVVEQANFDAAARFVDQGVGNQAADGIFFNDVGLNVDTLFRVENAL